MKFDKTTHVFCDTSFRAAEDFGPLENWPADLKVALNRAMGNFRQANSDAGELADARVEWAKEPHSILPFHPWVVRVWLTFKRKKLN